MAPVPTSYTSSGKEACVEVAWLPGGDIGVRDSKNPAGPALTFTHTERAAFTAGFRNGGSATVGSP
ncbi:DUF397 domain-containing protein [Nocardia sp. NPDC019395]|uniref:DUF397 domain-containing protein n=1 Tax=Nocardia sp. NPDC019395 TaxID=3154686 RepID=UPI0033C7AE89